MSLHQTLKNRGYIAQETHPLQDILDNKKTHFYIGYDPTADSLHVGHFLTLMAASILQKHGHTPIILLGGGTSMVGDPSGRSDMRRMLSEEDIQKNIDNIKKQMGRFISFESKDDKPAAIMANNADWLKKLNYIEFLRDYGAMFSVNRMIKMDAYKNRMDSDTGLSFLEFNYMIMQAYDFLELHRRFGCILQLGGSDQWSNILAGVDLIRRAENKDAYGLTLSLLVKANGEKMGKTAGGALWLDAEKTTPYDFYQYFRNVDDTDVINCIKLLTFVSEQEIIEFSALKGKDINKAKIRLAYEVTKLIHGETEAKKAQEAAQSIFESGNNTGESVPTFAIEKSELEEGLDIVSLVIKVGLGTGRGEVRRLIAQNGIKINGEVITDDSQKIDISFIKDNHIMLQKGKKTFCKIVVGNVL